MQQEVYRAMWEQSSDEALAKLMRTGSDGYQYLGIMEGVRCPLMRLTVWGTKRELSCIGTEAQSSPAGMLNLLAAATPRACKLRASSN